MSPGMGGSRVGATVGMQLAGTAAFLSPNSRRLSPPNMGPLLPPVAGCGLASYLWRQPRVRYQLSKLIGSSFSRRRRGLIPL